MTNLVNAVLDPLKSAGDMAKGLLEVRDTVKFADTVIQLQAQIMAAQQGAFAAQSHEATMAEEIRSLKKRMAELEAWEAEKQRYELTDFGSSTFAHTLKKGMEKGEPPHSICTNCYQKGHKSVLHFDRENAYGQQVFSCPSCEKTFNLGTPKDPPISVGRPSYGRGGSWMGA